MCCNDQGFNENCISCIDSLCEREGVLSSEPMQNKAYKFFDKETKTERLERLFKGWKKKMSAGGTNLVGYER